MRRIIGIDQRPVRPLCLRRGVLASAHRRGPTSRPVSGFAVWWVTGVSKRQVVDYVGELEKAPAAAEFVSAKDLGLENAEDTVP